MRDCRLPTDAKECLESPSLHEAVQGLSDGVWEAALKVRAAFEWRYAAWLDKELRSPPAVDTERSEAWLCRSRNNSPHRAFLASACVGSSREQRASGGELQWLSAAVRAAKHSQGARQFFGASSGRGQLLISSISTPAGRPAGASSGGGEQPHTPSQRGIVALLSAPRHCPVPVQGWHFDDGGHPHRCLPREGPSTKHCWRGAGGSSCSPGGAG